ncbi:DUF418 domain-containing protein [Evansella sp. AB-rgal1]|uniref:DUF418 domain-containing protein n=1 Tax=Evansella sp. AB-rgal1 TaxID=3242696 RepID=UPI00359CCB50
MKTERIQLIDSIRGLSLLGILIANMLIFQYGMYGKDEITFPLSSFDSTFHTLLKISVEGSFMPIFAFLFGFGLIKMKENLELNQIGVKRTFFRRFLFLVVLGFLHGTYLWEGDILFSYGLAGIFLLLFLKRKPKTILVWAIVLFTALSIMGYGSVSSSIVEDPDKINEYINDANQVYSEGTYLEVKDFRNNVDPLEALGLTDELIVILFLLVPFITAPPFLVGMYAAKKGWFTKPTEEIGFYKKGTILLPIGLIFKALYYLLPNQDWTGIAFTAGSTLLSLGYIFLVSYLYIAWNKNALFPWFSYVGRLSLTNYLVQTVIFTTIFYGYGFGFFGKLGVFYGFLLCLVTYFIQALLSKYYLKYCKVGPIERIVRSVTYFSLSGRPKPKHTPTKEKPIGA